jgi:mono/diheme cytochrome c family protein
LLLGMAGALAGCKSGAPPKPLDQLNAQEMHGHAVYQARCVVCHSDRTDQKRNGPPMLGVYKKPYLPSGASANDERVAATILHGRNMMPAQGNVIDQQELDDLLAYLHTL